MVQLIAGFILIFIGLIALAWRSSGAGDNLLNRLIRKAFALLFFAVGLLLFASTSFVIVDSDEVGHLKKIYLGRSMSPGQIIAVEGEKGPQARILPPGFHFSPFIRVNYLIEYKPVVSILSGTCGLITAMDGVPLREGQVFADEWPDNQIMDMLDATHFLKNGGQKGPQVTILKPGKYRINQYLFDVKTGIPVTSIAPGFVGVVKSNVQQVEEVMDVAETVTTGLNLVATVVPKGHRGVWKEVLQPGQYYLNTEAFQVTQFDTRVQTWEYAGGYHRRWLDLDIGQDGKISQKAREADIPIPQDAADMAIIVKVEGWEVPVDMRILLQVPAEKAPYVVASVGDIEEIENDVLTPTIRSVARNVAGATGKKVFDLVDKRAELEELIEQAIIPEGEKAWVSIKEIRIGDSVIPPELMVARQREQLATQLKITFGQERDAQEIRVETEKKRALADQQPILMTAQIEKDAADFKKDAAKLMGEGEKLRLTQIAEGQKMQADVLGQDRVMQLAMLREILDAAVKQPEIVKVPAVYVQGNGTGLEGAAAVLGASNILRAIGQPAGFPAEAEAAKK
jgi:hypothetical protein